MRTRLLNALVTGVLLMVAACDSQQVAQTDLTVLRIGVLPDQNPKALKERYDPLFEHLSSTLKVSYEFVPSKSYGDLLEQFVAGRMDLAFFGGLTFLKAQAASGAMPIVMRDVDKRFTSYFIVRANDPATSIKDYRNRNFCFGSHLSTSGHLMPRKFLAERGIIPEEFFAEVCHTGAHDRTVFGVRDGLADIGVANSQVVKSMLADGRLSENDVRILWETPPFPDYVWAVRATLGSAWRQRVRDAFLGLSPGNERDARILARIGAEAFLPASTADFDPLQEVAKTVGVLKLDGGA
ncbi:MAG: phosphate/phosphite/phosphonate ABC transporter substrate-binding protein [Rhodospirillales bacterium]|jgi:phosphonate transport system substrate-binding protein|nr:phosphate/phosphite/phosphonate ABC transporter substrate-binding protein [Rhodospirillales bacterium]